MQKLPGTILPSAESLRIAEEMHKKDENMRESVAKRCLQGLDRRVIGGEVRYYDTTDQYAIVSRQGRVLWFAVTPEGDYRI